MLYLIRLMQTERMIKTNRLGAANTDKYLNCFDCITDTEFTSKFLDEYSNYQHYSLIEVCMSLLFLGSDHLNDLVLIYNNCESQCGNN
jgi:hypothetical protein